MAITFNTTDGIQGNLGANGLYAHITQVAGPHKIAATTDPVIAEHWDVGYEVIVHKDKSTRDADFSPWFDKILVKRVDRFKWSAANLDIQPTLPVLYEHLKSELSDISGISSITDVI